MRTRHRAHAIVLVMVTLSTGACAAARRADVETPISSLASIAGTWTGTIEFGAGEQPCRLTIEPDGRAVIEGRTITQYGTVSVQGSRSTYDFPARSTGTVTLYEEGGKRQLHRKGVGGVFDIWVTK